MEPKIKRRRAFSSRGFSSLLDWIHIAFVAMVIVGIVNSFFLQMILVEQNSMLPTFKSGERVLLNKSAYWFSDVERGDVVVFYLESADCNYVKRVIGLPGDTVIISDGNVKVNDELLVEDYISESTQGEFSITVPENKYFVLGDNRNLSVDSREESFGCISKESLLGKVIIINIK